MTTPSRLQPALLKLFVDIADSGSISGVAAERGTAQSYISRLINQLERQCGSRLFRRTGRGVVLTEVGERLLPRVRSWLASTEELEDEIASTTGAVIGRVRVGVLPSTADNLAPELYRRARDQFPGIKLYIVEGQGPQLDGWIENGKLDIALLFRYGERDDREEKILTKTDTYLVGPAGDKITASPTVEFARLAGLQLVLPSHPSAWRSTLDDIGRQTQTKLTIAVEADSLSFQKSLVEKGLCYTLLGPYAIAGEVAANRLQASKIVQPRIRRTIRLVMSQHGPLTLACRTAVKLISTIVAESGHLWLPSED